MFTESASLASADVAGDVHLGTGLGEGEVTRAQAYLGVGAEHLAGKGEEHLFQVGETHVLVYIQSFHLMEEAMCAGTDGLITIYASWTKNAEWGLMTFHVVGLIIAGVRTQEDVFGHIVGIALLDEECVLHVSGGMVGRKVEHGEHVFVIIYLRTIGQHEAHARENVDDVVGDNGKWMARAQLNGVGGAREVDVVTSGLGLFQLLPQLVDAGDGSLLELVDLDADRLFLFGGDIVEIGHEGIDFTFLTKIFQAKLFNLLGIGSRESAYLF